MSRKILKTGLFFLAVLLMSAPAWCATPAGTGPFLSTANLTAEAGAVLPDLLKADFILAKGGGGNRGGKGADKGDRDQDKDGDCDPDGDANGFGAASGGDSHNNGPGGQDDDNNQDGSRHGDQGDEGHHGHDGGGRR